MPESCEAGRASCFKVLSLSWGRRCSIHRARSVTSEVENHTVPKVSDWWTWMASRPLVATDGRRPSSKFVLPDQAIVLPETVPTRRQSVPPACDLCTSTTKPSSVSATAGVTPSSYCWLPPKSTLLPLTFPTWYQSVFFASDLWTSTTTPPSLTATRGSTPSSYFWLPPQETDFPATVPTWYHRVLAACDLWTSTATLLLLRATAGLTPSSYFLLPPQSTVAWLGVPTRYQRVLKVSDSCTSTIALLLIATFGLLPSSYWTARPRSTSLMVFLSRRFVERVRSRFRAPAFAHRRPRHGRPSCASGVPAPEPATRLPQSTQNKGVARWCRNSGRAGLADRIDATRRSDRRHPPI